MRERQLADLVEEHASRRRPPRGGRPCACVGAGERALLVAEELALEERLGERGAVERDERARRARRAVVDDLAATRPPCPTPVSPRMSTLKLVLAIRPTRSSRRLIASSRRRGGAAAGARAAPARPPSRSRSRSSLRERARGGHAGSGSPFTRVPLALPRSSTTDRIALTAHDDCRVSPRHRRVLNDDVGAARATQRHAPRAADIARGVTAFPEHEHAPATRLPGRRLGRARSDLVLWAVGHGRLARAPSSFHHLES